MTARLNLVLQKRALHREKAYQRTVKHHGLHQYEWKSQLTQDELFLFECLFILFNSVFLLAMSSVSFSCTVLFSCISNHFNCKLCIFLATLEHLLLHFHTLLLSNDLNLFVLPWSSLKIGVGLPWFLHKLCFISTVPQCFMLTTLMLCVYFVFFGGRL